jgi:hypothetical protein
MATVDPELSTSSVAPRSSSLLMTDDPAPTWVILLLLAVALFGTALVLTTIVSRWNDALQGTGSLVQRQSGFSLAKDLAEQASKELQRLQDAHRSAEQALQAVREQPDRAAATTQLEASKKAAEAAALPWTLVSGR